MKKLAVVFVIFSMMSVNFIPPVVASQILWQKDLEEKFSWNQVTYFGTLLVGSNSSLSSYDPDSGELMWKRDDLNKIAPFDVREVTGWPIAVLNLDRGIGGQKSSVEAINLDNGQTMWKTEEFEGFALGTYALAEKGIVLFFVNLINGEEVNGVHLYAYKAETGELLWKTPYGQDAGKISTHLADNSGAFYARQDLSGHMEPVVDGDLLYVPFSGVHCFDLNTGALQWGVPFKPAHKTLKKAYAPLVIDGDLIYATGSGVVYAVNKLTGEIKWQTEKVSSGLIAQLVVTPEMVMARLGGNFFDQGGRVFKLDKPLGVIAYNKEDGQMLWEFKGASGGITNLVYLPAKNTVMFSDATSLIGIDTNSTGKVKEAFRLPLEFKRSLGAKDLTSAGVKALTGGIGGMLRAGIKLADSKDRRDIPVAVTEQENGTLVVRGKQHLLSFNPENQEIPWSTYFAAPGASNFEFIAMTALTVFSVAVHNANYASGGASMSSASDRIVAEYDRLDMLVNRRYSKSKNTQKYSYILTSVEDAGKKGVGILAIDMETGDSVHQVYLGEKDPEYTVDDVEGRVYFFDNKKSIVAYDVLGEK
jgi:outer membrane protein assembly factor BamB